MRAHELRHHHRHPALAGPPGPGPRRDRRHRRHARPGRQGQRLRRRQRPAGRRVARGSERTASPWAPSTRRPPCWPPSPTSTSWSSSRSPCAARWLARRLAGPGRSTRTPRGSSTRSPARSPPPTSWRSPRRQTPRRVVLEGLTSMRRFGMTEDEVAAAITTLSPHIASGAIRLEGLALHLPIATPEEPRIGSMAMLTSDDSAPAAGRDRVRAGPRGRRLGTAVAEPAGQPGRAVATPARSG